MLVEIIESILQGALDHQPMKASDPPEIQARKWAAQERAYVDDLGGATFSYRAVPVDPKDWP
jgi:hypothetical protein